MSDKTRKIPYEMVSTDEKDIWNKRSEELSDKLANDVEQYNVSVADYGPPAGQEKFIQGTNTGSPKRMHPNKKPL
ncbi:hypothetical protein [Heliophilum fasciatum]|uniref:Uncharacterized protein n=1 Tax=Heliophilum fasciatum TaxID=35700 RepID=A0A4R2RPS4_9FIRM|nr:hypothetical protein [Heliophilum fasciatum]MCW2277576.1 hypothetical protein [Heliophilum fasciatum]TCP65134.1 hypothetical protein EDD73_10612 [Heliophilum fasciatum]